MTSFGVNVVTVLPEYNRVEGYVPFVFTGQFPGTTSIDVASLQPGPSFITADPNQPILDPANTPGARINVASGAVPEPSGLVLLGVASLMLGAGWLRCRE